MARKKQTNKQEPAGEALEELSDAQQKELEKEKEKETEKLMNEIYDTKKTRKQKQENPRKYVGKLVKNLQDLHDKEYKVVFSLHENTFFQKMISIM